MRRKMGHICSQQSLVSSTKYFVNPLGIFVEIIYPVLEFAGRTPTCDVMSLNTRRVSASQFLCWATLAEIWPAIFVLSPSFQPKTFTCRTLSVFSGPFNSILMMWLSPPGSSLVIQPMCLESRSTWQSRKGTETWHSCITFYHCPRLNTSKSTNTHNYTKSKVF